MPNYKNLSRTTLTQISGAWNAGGLTGRSRVYYSTRAEEVLVCNCHYDTLYPENCVELRGYATSDMEYQYSYSRMRAGNLVYAARYPLKKLPSECVAVVQERIEVGKIGRARFAGVIEVPVHFDDVSQLPDTSDGDPDFSDGALRFAVPYAMSFEARAEPTPYYIIARSSLNAKNYAVCSLVRRVNLETEDITYIKEIRVESGMLYLDYALVKIITEITS